MVPQILRRRVDAESDASDPTDDEVVLFGLLHAQGDVRLAHSEAEFSRVRDELDHDVGMLRMKLGEAWREDMGGQGLGAGDANQTPQAACRAR